MANTTPSSSHVLLTICKCSHTHTHPRNVLELEKINRVIFPAFLRAAVRVNQSSVQISFLSGIMEDEFYLQNEATCTDTSNVRELERVAHVTICKMFLKSSQFCLKFKDKVLDVKSVDDHLLHHSSITPRRHLLHVKLFAKAFPYLQLSSRAGMSAFNRFSVARLASAL